MDRAAAEAQSGEVFLDGARSADFSVGESYAREGVRVASSDPDLAKLAGQAVRVQVRFRPHLAIANFECGYVGGEPVEVFLGAAASEAREYVVHAEKQFTLRQ